MKLIVKSTFLSYLNLKVAFLFIYDTTNDRRRECDPSSSIHLQRAFASEGKHKLHGSLIESLLLVKSLNEGPLIKDRENPTV